MQNRYKFCFKKNDLKDSLELNRKDAFNFYEFFKRNGYSCKIKRISETGEEFTIIAC